MKTYTYPHTIGAKGSSSDSGKLFAGVDVLENGLIETRKVFVAFLEHGLNPIGLNVETHVLAI